MCTEPNTNLSIPVPIMAALISASIAAVVAWLINRKTRRDQERSEINSLINQLNLISIQHPVLEDDDYCSAWPPKSRLSENDMRYDNYCCLVFNLIERIWRHFKGDVRKINDYFGASEMFYRHRNWWMNSKNRSTNYGGYPLEFIIYVDSVLKELK